MKRYVTLGFSIAAGAALGAAAVQTIHAQTKPMGYVIALNVVNDPDSHAKGCASVVDKTIVDEALVCRYVNRIPLGTRQLISKQTTEYALT